MSNPAPPSVFLSYASQDAAAAQRIAEAMRAAGIDVWFDQSELRGGDAWDAKIRHQIQHAALFVPVISRNTQARPEGYFRLEWKLAVDRSHLMSDDHPFLMPVVIDDTGDAEARVPARFRERQWTRLPDGAEADAFARRAMQLLSGAASPRPAVGVPASAPARKPRWIAAVAIVAVALLGGGAYFASQAMRTPAAAAIAADPSIAVLPFTNLSADKGNEYFSDGIAEELLNLLAKVPRLRVISRTSSFAFRGKESDVAEIARKLNVGAVLEGSVQKAGNRVRITVQLIRAADRTQLWSETYDRTIEDIFTVQDEIAATVVGQLKVRLLGAAPKAVAVDPRAYALLLKAKFLADQGSIQSRINALDFYQQAAAIAPDAARAWVGQADIYTAQSNFGERHPEEGFRLSREAANTALKAEPNNAQALSLLGVRAANYDNDLAAAAGYFARALELEPANLEILNNAATLLLLLDRRDEALQVYTYLATHDPVNPIVHYYACWAHYGARRWDKAVSSCRTASTLSPQFSGAHFMTGEALLFQGDAAAARVEIMAETGGAWRWAGIALAEHALGNHAASDAALEHMITKYPTVAPWNIAYVYAYRGEPDQAFAWLDKAEKLHDVGIAYINSEPMFSNLYNDPRWKVLMRKLGKLPEQQATIKFQVPLPK